MIIYGPIEYIIPVFIVIFLIIIIVMIICYIAMTIESKKLINKAMVVYPETLFQDIEIMKNNNTLRLYAEKIEKNLFVITSDQLSKKYQNNQFISYSKDKEVIKAQKESLKDFIKKVPEIDYKSMNLKIGKKARIQLKTNTTDNDFIPLTYYSDVGFDIRQNGDIIKLIDYFDDENKNFECKKIYDFAHGECELEIYKIGNIRYYCQSEHNGQGKHYCYISLGYENENISVFDETLKSYHQEENNLDFPTISVTKEIYTFWFSCLNLYEYPERKQEPIKLKISSFANNIEIHDPTDEIENKSELVPFADESYITADKNPAIGYVSGTIKSFCHKTNPLTNNEYWEIDIECLGTNIRVLADYRMIKSSELQIGKILSGKMWNTAVIVE